MWVVEVVSGSNAPRQLADRMRSQKPSQRRLFQRSILGAGWPRTRQTTILAGRIIGFLIFLIENYLMWDGL
jgi:hypothetical protein